MDHNVITLPSRTDPVPWYRDRTLYGHDLGVLGDEVFPEVARHLPGDVWVPADYVHATLTTHLWWSKPLSISWMQMDYDEDRGCEVPIQHHMRGAHVLYIDDDAAAFGIAETGAERFEPRRVQVDCVTDIALELFPSPPIPPGCQVDG